ncbi:MAG TPA: A/G-specific adenine glycosylase [Candidatus Polarisedimenticolaceae bacterium]|nr:A/G-specific adenine glycosylase [Candidatus Polarisedimenticolaceae bacterium]
MRRALLKWYDDHRRDLPWRRTSDPYAIWVSEVMLQQTRAATVIPYYRRFIRRFPDPFALAEATEDEVLSAWTGLGYYRRARMLRAGARAIVERHGGRLPDDPAVLIELPGIGRYTAGAIASIAYGKPAAVLDGNVRRVLARLLAIDGAVCGPAEERRRLWSAAGELVRGARPGDVNQALMELGALVCTPANPDCTDCPLRRRCRAASAGNPSGYPSASRRAAALDDDAAVLWLEHRGKLLLAGRTADTPLRGNWDLPTRIVRAGVTSGETIRRLMRERYGLTLAVGARTTELTHGIMKRRLRLLVHRGARRAGRVAAADGLRWVAIERLGETPVSGATRKIVRIVSGFDPFGEAVRPATGERPTGDRGVESGRIGRDRDQGQ